MKKSASNQLNTQLLNFKEIGVIGIGSFGEVRLVEKNGSYYAMKVLEKKPIEYGNVLAAIQQERDILLALNHPNIVKLHHWLDKPDKFYLFLEYCPGGDLFNRISRRRHTQQQVKFYAAQLVDIIEYLHQKNIVYRDLKPENILIDQSGYIKLTDFGLSHFDTPENRMKTSGTQFYFAPQILFSLPNGKPIDWWTLGILIYELVFGQPPFYHNYVSQVFRQIKTCPVNFPAHANPLIINLLQGLLEKDPKKRLGTNKEGTQIRKHAWFAGFDWVLLRKRWLNAPFIPKLKSKIDISNFNLEQGQNIPLISEEFQKQKYRQNKNGFSTVDNKKVMMDLEFKSQLWNISTGIDQQYNAYPFDR